MPYFPFRSLDDAMTEAAAKAVQLARGDVDAVQLSGKDRLIYGRALEAIRTFDVPLDAAAIEYAQARQLLERQSIVEAARFCVRHYGRPTDSSVRFTPDCWRGFARREIKHEQGRITFTPQNAPIYRGSSAFNYTGDKGAGKECFHSAGLGFKTDAADPVF